MALDGKYPGITFHMAEDLNTLICTKWDPEVRYSNQQPADPCCWIHQTTIPSMAIGVFI